MTVTIHPLYNCDGERVESHSITMYQQTIQEIADLVAMWQRDGLPPPAMWQGMLDNAQHFNQIMQSRKQWGDDKRRRGQRAQPRPLCGAVTRCGTSCRAKCQPGKARCRMHGGLSTGPKTQEGRARIAESNRRRGRKGFRDLDNTGQPAECRHSPKPLPENETDDKAACAG